jgi:predicted MFS family arabinose efflux permease
MLISSAYAIVPKFLPGEINGWAFGILSVGAALGIAVGAPVGGIVNQYLTWHWIFLINVPVGIIAIITSWKMIPAEKTEAGNFRLSEFDIPGTLLSLAGFSLLLYGINIGHAAGWVSTKVLLPIILSTVLIASFCLWERKSRTPLLDFSIFRDKRFNYATISAFFGLAVLGGSTFVMPFYLELGKRLDSMESGFLLMTFSIGYIICAPIAGRLSDKLQPSLLSTVGMASLAFATFFFSRTLGYKGLIFPLIYLVWLSLSFAVFFSPNNSFVMSLPAEDKKGVASGCYNAAGVLGTALGVAIFETVFSIGLSIYDLSTDGTLKHPGAAACACSLAFIAGMALSILAAVFSGLNIKGDSSIIAESFKKHSFNLHH